MWVGLVGSDFPGLLNAECPSTAPTHHLYIAVVIKLVYQALNH